MKVAGTTVVVTGAGDGIGRELVLGLLARGARVAAVSRSAEHLQETVTRAGRAGDRVSVHAVDVADRPAVEALPAAVVDAHGQVDGLINCAGIIQPFVPLLDLDYANIERVMAVNFWGPVHTTKAFLPAPRREAESAPGQRVEHGRVPAGPRADRLRSVEGGRAAPHRGAARRAGRHVGVGHGRLPRSDPHRDRRELRGAPAGRHGRDGAAAGEADDVRRRRPRAASSTRSSATPTG